MNIHFMEKYSEKDRLKFIMLAFVASIVFIYFYLKFHWGFDCGLTERFGVYCPLCGGTRAFKELLRFNFVGAYNYNKLFVVTLPLTVGYMMVKIREFIQFGRVTVSSNVIKLACFALISFGIVRNII